MSEGRMVVRERGAVERGMMPNLGRKLTGGRELGIFSDGIY